MHEPRIALAASPRGWAQALHRHVADHGGAQVRATVLHQQDAIAEDYDVFIGDDSTSFLTRRLVDELHRRGRSVLGVFDPDDPRGKGELVDMGVDELIAREEPPSAFLAAITALHDQQAGRRDDVLAGAVSTTTERGATPAVEEGGEAPAGRVVAVGAAGGGAGATEVTVGLAQAASRRGSVAVVDADDVSPALAQRLGLPLYPNLRAAVDALEHRTRPLAELLSPVAGGRFEVLAGASTPRSGGELDALAVVDVVRQLSRRPGDVLVNVGPRVEDLSGGLGPGRYGVTRAVLRAADTAVGVAQPTPVGLARLLDWLGELRLLAPAAAVHVVFDRAPTSAFKQEELAAELQRTFTPAGVWFVPSDPRVESAAWAGRLTASGPFLRTVAEAAAVILPSAPAPRRSWRRRVRA